MIRRDAHTGDGDKAWVLIDQVAHAHVSGDLAKYWGTGPIVPVEPREILLPTIYRHDDGWTSYDREPDIDAESGRPFAFTEMPLRTANVIWSRSIEQVADLGALSQYVVASHFVSMRSDGERGSTPMALEFVQHFGALCEQWLKKWRDDNPSQNTPERADTALQHLQLFDALSLWFCCADPSEPATFCTPGDRCVTFSPRDNGRHITVSPWPFTVETLRIEAEARSVPVNFYPDKSSFMAAETTPEILAWELSPEKANP